MSVVLACCTLINAVDQLRPDYNQSQAKGDFEELDQWLNNDAKRANPKIALKDANSAIKNRSGELSEGLRRALKILIDLTKIKKCNDAALDLARIVVSGTTSNSIQSADKVLKHFAQKAVTGCEKYIDEKFQILFEDRRKKQIFGVNVQPVLDYTYEQGEPFNDRSPYLLSKKLTDSFLQKLASKHLIVSQNEFEELISLASQASFAGIHKSMLVNGNEVELYHRDKTRNLFNERFVNSCKLYNGMMGDFFESIYSVQSLVYGSNAVQFIKERTVNFKIDLTRYLVCQWILDIKLDDILDAIESNIIQEIG